MLDSRGLAVLFTSCVFKLVTDLVTELVEKTNYRIWGDISIMTCATLYLIILLISKYGKKSNLLVFVWIFTVTVFGIGICMENENIKLIGVAILMNRWDKINKIVGRWRECWDDLTNRF
ncbi:MAG: hypothetical protein ACRCZO_03220 [Cetobacterium sp.]